MVSNSTSFPLFNTDVVTASHRPLPPPVLSSGAPPALGRKFSDDKTRSDSPDEFDGSDSPPSRRSLDAKSVRDALTTAAAPATASPTGVITTAAPATASATAMTALQRKLSDDKRRSDSPDEFESDSPPSKRSLDGKRGLSFDSPKMHSPIAATKSTAAASSAAASSSPSTATKPTKPYGFHRRLSSRDILSALSPPSDGSASDKAKVSCVFGPASSSPTTGNAAAARVAAVAVPRTLNDLDGQRIRFFSLEHEFSVRQCDGVLTINKVMEYVFPGFTEDEFQAKYQVLESWLVAIQNSEISFENGLTLEPWLLGVREELQQCDGYSALFSANAIKADMVKAKKKYEKKCTKIVASMATIGGRKGLLPDFRTYFTMASDENMKREYNPKVKTAFARQLLATDSEGLVHPQRLDDLIDAILQRISEIPLPPYI